jgi:hypothetical protein
MSDRNASIVVMYANGSTLQQIGDRFSITGERVRQIIEKFGGDEAKAQCRAARSNAALRAAEKLAAGREAKCLEKNGCSPAELQELQRLGFNVPYGQQKRNAAMRGIEWKFTIASWSAFWIASGKWGERGRGGGLYCMCRRGDAGPYSPDNCYIGLGADNSRDGLAGKPRGVKEFVGVFSYYPGSSRPWVAKYGKELVGRFSTQEEANQAREEYIAQRSPGRPANARWVGLGYTFLPNRKSPYQVMCGSTYVGAFKTPEAAISARIAFLQKKSAMEAA